MRASPAITVRVAAQADFQEWARMRHSLWPVSSIEELLSELQEWSKNPDFVGFVALSGEHMIGFAEASIRPFANGCEARPVAFLEGIWVEPSERAKGVGRKLVKAVEDWALGHGLRELGSDAELANTLSHEVHGRWGFQETERVVYFRKGLGRE